MKDNQRFDSSQIGYLKDCKKLEILCLIENPISKQPNYRKKILEILPFLKKLDDLENTDFDKNPPPACASLPQSPFILFKKIFPKKANKFNSKMKLDTSLNDPNNDQKNNNFNEKNNENKIMPKKDKKSDLLNKSFQKKKTIGTFRKIGNKKNNMNLDLSVDYAKDLFGTNHNEIIDPNRSTYVGEYKSNITEMISARNKYNKKVVGNFKKDQIKNYQSTMLTYQEFDAPVKKEENKKILNDNNKNNVVNKIIEKNDKPKKNEKVVIESIRLLLNTLNLSELKYVNNDIQKILKDKNK